jgi:ABC-2 type transport system ATP-binding protein
VNELTEAVGKHYNISIKTSRGTETFEADNIGESLISILKGYREKRMDIQDVQVDRGSLEQHFVRIARGRKE